MEKLFEHPNVTVLYDEYKNQIRINWQGTPEVAVYKEALNVCYDCIEKKRVSKFLIDQTGVEYVSAEAQAWLSVCWFPKVEALLQQDLYFSIISSGKLYVKMASDIVAKRLSNVSKGFLNVHYFEKELQAKMFLEQLPN